MAKKKTEKTATKKTTKTEDAKYFVEFNLNGEVFRFSTDNLLEGFQAFDAPVAIKTDLDVTVRSGDKVEYQTINVAKARRAFNNKVALELLARNLERLFG